MLLCLVCVNTFFLFKQILRLHNNKTGIITVLYVEWYEYFNILQYLFRFSLSNQNDFGTGLRNQIKPDQKPKFKM